MPIWNWAWTRTVLTKQAAIELFQSTGNNTAKSVAWTLGLADLLNVDSDSLHVARHSENAL